MDFKQYLLNYLSTVNDPTMKQVLDHIIKYAREQGKYIYIYSILKKAYKLKERNL